MTGLVVSDCVRRYARGPTSPGPTGGDSHNSSSNDSVEETTRIRTDVRSHAACGVSRNREHRPPGSHPRCGFGRPAPCQRSRGTSCTRHIASQTSRAGTPPARACSGVRLPSSTITVSRNNTRPNGPNSSSTARENSLSFRRTLATSARRGSRRTPPRARRGACRERDRTPARCRRRRPRRRRACRPPRA